MKKCEECGEKLKIEEYNIYLFTRNVCNKCFQRLKIKKRYAEKGLDVRKIAWLDRYIVEQKNG